MGRMILENVERLPEAYKRELLRGERVQAELAILEQQRLKEASDLLETRHIEGLGQKVLCITRDLAARLRMKYGMSCLHDPDFRRRLLQQNPFLRVRSIPQKTTVRVNGLRPARATPDYECAGRSCDPVTNGRETPTKRISGHETTSGAALAVPEQEQEVYA